MAKLVQQRVVEEMGMKEFIAFFFNGLILIKSFTVKKKKNYTKRHQRETPKKIPPPLKKDKQKLYNRGGKGASKQKEERECRLDSSHFPPIVHNVVKRKAPKLYKDGNPGGNAQSHMVDDRM